MFGAVAVQLGAIGIISIFDDFGEAEAYYRQCFESVLKGRSLHPVQFWELAGRIFYHAYVTPLEVSTPIIEGPHDVMMNLAPRPTKGPQADEAEEAFWVAQVAGGEPEMFWNPQTRASRTVLLRPDGSFNEMPLEDVSPAED